MRLQALLGHSAGLFRIIWKSSEPADKIASKYFREKKYIGSKDRKFVSENVFASLRMKALSEYCASQASEKINTLNNVEQDEKEFKHALEIGTLNAYINYKRKFPYGQFVKKANIKILELE